MCVFMHCWIFGMAFIEECLRTEPYKLSSWSMKNMKKENVNLTGKLTILRSDKGIFFSNKTKLLPQ